MLNIYCRVLWNTVLGGSKEDKTGKRGKLTLNIMTAEASASLIWRAGRSCRLVSSCIFAPIIATGHSLAEHVIFLKQFLVNWEEFLVREAVIIFPDHRGYTRRRQWQPPPSVLAWKIPWAEESGGLQSMGSLRVGHDWEMSLSLFTFMHWRRKWQPTPVLLSGESEGRRSLVGCRLWGRTESDMAEAT